MTDFISEISESETRTSYPVTARIIETRTAFCPSVIIADSPTFRRMLFLDGELQSAEADERIYHETLVHPVMALCANQTETHRRVLVVGGGEGATIREVLKWDPTYVDWVDIDGELVSLCRTHLKWAPEEVYTDPRVHFQAIDIREALSTSLNAHQYDVIILDLPDPDGVDEYLYGPEFWQSIWDHLGPKGFVVTHCGPVRPWGLIGEGFQRVRRAEIQRDPSDPHSRSRLFDWDSDGFYHQLIPSFQGEWGFMIGAKNQETLLPFISENLWTQLFPDIYMVDRNQMRCWGSKGGKLWLDALALF